MSDVLRFDSELTKKFGVREWHAISDLTDFTKDCRDCPMCPMASPFYCKNIKCIMERGKILWYVLGRYGY